MTSIRRRFGIWVTRVAGGFGAAGPRLATGDALRAANVAWVIMLILVIVISASIVYWSTAAIRAEILLAVFWGLFIGVTMLFYFPPKLLITIVGGLAGVIGTDLAGMAEVIERTSEIIKRIVQVLNAALDGEVTLHPVSAWLFLVLIIICCLPAYREHQ